MSNLKIYLTGDISTITSADVKSCTLIAPNYEVDQDGLLLFCPGSATQLEDHSELARLVILELLKQDCLHHYHTSLEGGHIGRTYQRNKAKFHWKVLHRSVQRYVGECVDCKIGKGSPCDRSGSPVNIQATYFFQILAMDHVPSLPMSFRTRSCWSGSTCSLIMWLRRRVRFGPNKRSRRIKKNVYSERLTRVKPFVTIESQDSYLISFVRLIRSWDRNNELLWLIDHKQSAQRNAWHRR